MRVISNTRWTSSCPADEREPAARLARARIGQDDEPQPAGVHELEAAEVEHQRGGSVLGRHPLELVLEQRGAGDVQLAGQR